MAFPGSRGDERRVKRARLSRSTEFDRVYREGRSHANRYLVVYSFPRAMSGDIAELPARLGVSVGRKVGGAVQRNRVKRSLREAFWTVAGDLPAGRDVVLVARPAARELAEEGGSTTIEAALRDLLETAGLTGNGSA